MGLDITAYRQLTKLDCVFDEDGEPIDASTKEPLDYDLRVYINPDFPGRADDLTPKAIYSATESIGFCAGGYGGYNAWRDSLAQLAGYPKGTYEQYGQRHESYCQACWDGAQGPFAELINFSDCEGVIGTAVSAKLAADFAKFDDQAIQHSEMSNRPDWFYPLYREWRAAFEMAADGGAVNFH
ncbi:hypothetical protein RBI14_15440 [Alcaligenaceae bacterium B3P038]|nr:hypothetical protein [Alcaligenaceae bacterium B3P038]